MNKIIQQVQTHHVKEFGEEPLVVRSPGRINIIGEHTDYNEGFVLPAAVDKYIYVGISRRTDSKIYLYSLNFNETVISAVETSHTLSTHWANYILGMADQLKEKLPSGFDMTFYGDVPLGAGMSSSAALESATGFALNELFDMGMDRMELALMGQRCEHTYIGVKCGIMDQFASLFGKDGHVIKLDCRDLSHTYVPMQMGDYVLLLLNTNVKHSLASSAYNQRREKCEQAVAYLQPEYPDVRSLRDANVDMLERVVLEKDKEAFVKAKFVVEEIQRVEESCAYLIQGNLQAMGQNMFATHTGLSKDYEVSCAELDFLVDYVRQFPEVLGARMMGGGFGGCTINIVHQDFVEELLSALRVKYQEQFGLALDEYRVELKNGTEIVNEHGY
ncbi:galactokinase [Sphingobacterium sp. FBM7-1]|uniref:galactokinase n=1 Tax=Sphingobacterium sp. FBM7-1 TaxID=2886688 RepID=UPI001D11DE64|nr:galactokinase [Sphingobacterium sp. FBM7-1]MCC2600295.1 galactokinase [Sphingobacterium sp. FBM7-1]